MTTIVVTGASSGIGLETAAALAATGATVVLTARDRARGEGALAEVRRRTGSDALELRLLDLASFASIRRFAAELLGAHDRLDVLVANAGVAPAGRRWETKEGIEATFGVDHLGHFLLTSLVLDRLVASAPARVVVVSSGAYAFATDGLCFDDLQHRGEFHSFRVYAESKLANLLFTQELARRLEGTGVTVNACNPGYVESGLGRIRPEDLERAEERPQPGSPGAPGAPLPTAAGAELPVRLATDPALATVTGRYFTDGAESELLPHGRDAQAAARLWAVSEELVAGAGA